MRCTMTHRGHNTPFGWELDRFQLPSQSFETALPYVCRLQNKRLTTSLKQEALTTPKRRMVLRHRFLPGHQIQEIAKDRTVSNQGQDNNSATEILTRWKRNNQVR